jgi:outer membrane protein TolC
LRIATSPLLPQLKLQGESVRTKKSQIDVPEQFGSGFSQPYEYSTLSMTASQHLYQGGKRWHERRASELSLESEKSRHYRLAQDVLFSVTASFYQVLLAERSIEIAEKQLDRTRRQLERAQQRFEVGLVDRTAVLRARVQVADAREQLERAENNRGVALENLALDMGTDIPPERLQNPEQVIFGDREVASFSKAALQNRRDLLELEQSIQALDKRAQGEQTDIFWPQFRAEGSYTLTNEEDLFNGEDDDWRVTLKAEYPLFTGWRDTAELSKARAASRRARARYERLRQAITAQVRSVYLDIRTQEKVISSLEDQVAASRSNYEQTIAQFNEGLASSVDVVVAEAGLTEAENRLANARFTYQLAQIQLKLATGTLYQDRLDAWMDSVQASK